uniref:Protein kinase domain-containing protein n=1 Tax=Aegilops tauschii subsp. strangulata TaxID=200361 RepID=A0A453SFC5_AEGTS
MVSAELSMLVSLLLALAASTGSARIPHAGTATSNSSDHSALLSFKSLIRDDPLQALESWGSRSTPMCQWHGVACGRRGRRRGRVVALDLGDLNLLGAVSASVANLTFLRRLHLPGNRLHGAVPSALGHLRYLKRLNLSDNSLDGAIPPSLSRCRQLDSISLGYNRLKGKIPWKLAALPNLGLLELRRNELQGEIPHELGSLHNLVVLDLGHNKLQGTIPSEISSLVNLEFVDISNNRLTGEIPPGIGSFGSVYKGTMRIDDQQVVIAVKVLNLTQRGASRSFVAECETLKCVRHRNLMKILTVCSSIDSQSRDFKALVYEYLPNGNLDKWLHHHPIEDGENRSLHLRVRLQIAIDVASSLEYLHQHKPMPIIHCDLKPSNVLLDGEMIAHVGDFGLARFLHQDSEKSTSWGSMRGTIGYAAPESMDWATKFQSMVMSTATAFCCWRCSLEKGQQTADSENPLAFTSMCKLHCQKGQQRS